MGTDAPFLQTLLLYQSSPVCPWGNQSFSTNPEQKQAPAIRLSASIPGQLLLLFLFTYIKGEREKIKISWEDCFRMALRIRVNKA